MASPVCIRAPFLRGPVPCGLDPEIAPRFPLALYLWPGHAAADAVPQNAWQPDNYPFRPREALACIEGLRRLDARDLEGMRQSLNRLDIAAEAGRLEEAHSLARFAAGNMMEKADADPGDGIRKRIILEQAQKVLLWLWLQEERLAEIASLAARYAQGARSLEEGLGENESARGEEAPGRCEFQGNAELRPDQSLLPPWRTCLANAAVFIPLETAIFIDSAILDHVSETMEFEPAPAWGEKLGCVPEVSRGMRAARAPLWLVLGSQGQYSGESAFLAHVYNSERSWLAWSGK